MKAWKYVSERSGHVVILAKEDDFGCLPTYLQAIFQGYAGRGMPWGDRPGGNVLPEHLIGANKSDIETALASRGWFCNK